MENITFTVLRIETFLFILEFSSNQKLERRKEKKTPTIFLITSISYIRTILSDVSRSMASGETGNGGEVEETRGGDRRRHRESAINTEDGTSAGDF